MRKLPIIMALMSLALTGSQALASPFKTVSIEARRNGYISSPKQQLEMMSELILKEIQNKCPHPNMVVNIRVFMTANAGDLGFGGGSVKGTADCYLGEE